MPIGYTNNYNTATLSMSVFFLVSVGHIISVKAFSVRHGPMGEPSASSSICLLVWRSLHIESVTTLDPPISNFH